MVETSKFFRLLNLYSISIRINWNDAPTSKKSKICTSPRNKPPTPPLKKSLFIGLYMYYIGVLFYWSPLPRQKFLATPLTKQSPADGNGQVQKEDLFSVPNQNRHYVKIF